MKAAHVINRYARGALGRRRKKTVIAEKRDQERQFTLAKAAEAMASLDAGYSEGGLNTAKWEDEPATPSTPGVPSIPALATPRRVAIRSGSSLMTVQNSDTKFSVENVRANPRSMMFIHSQEKGSALHNLRAAGNRIRAIVSISAALGGGLGNSGPAAAAAAAPPAMKLTPRPPAKKSNKVGKVGKVGKVLNRSSSVKVKNLNNKGSSYTKTKPRYLQHLDAAPLPPDSSKIGERIPTPKGNKVRDLTLSLLHPPFNFPAVPPRHSCGRSDASRPFPHLLWHCRVATDHRAQSRAGARFSRSSRR